MCCNVYDDFTDYEVGEFIKKTKICMSWERTIFCSNMAVILQKK